MPLKVGDLVIPVRVVDRSHKRSKHTGAELEILEVEAELTGEEAHRAFSDAIHEKGTRGVTSSTESGVPAGEWEITTQQYSISGSKYVYSLKLTRAENLRVDSLILDELVLKPYRYEESFSGDALTSDAWIMLGETERNRLLNLMKGKLYFSVVRHGISDVAREMRFGRPVWSRDGSEFKYHLILIDRAYDEGRTSNRLDFEDSTARWALANYQGITTHLLSASC